MKGSAKKVRDTFRRRLRRMRGLDNGARAIADSELGAFLGALTRQQATRIAEQHLWFLEPLERALIVSAALGDPPLSPERHRALLHQGIREDQREALNEAVEQAMQAWHPNPKGNGS